MENELKASLAENQRNRFHVFKCDVSKEDDILNAFKIIEEKFGGVDVLINCAGIMPRTQIVAENNTTELRDTLEVNVLGTALCTREAFRSMKKRGFNGHVILLNSGLGHHVTKPPGRSYNIYSPSKYAIIALAEILRHEFLLNDTKVKVTSISPFLVDTAMLTRNSYPETTLILNPDDIADAITYCLQTPPHVQIHELTVAPFGVAENIKRVA